MLRFKKVIILLSLMLELLLASIEPFSNSTCRLTYIRKLIDEESSCQASFTDGKSHLNLHSSIYMPSTKKLSTPLGSDSSLGFSTISNILASFKTLCISPNFENKVASTDDRDYYDKLMEALSTKSSTIEVQPFSPTSASLNL